MTTELENAYMAGLFDGEGSVSLSSAGIVKQVSLGSTDKNLIEWIERNYGGNINKNKEKEGLKPFYNWYTAKLEIIINLVNKILPYARVKREQLVIIKEACTLYRRNNPENHLRRAVLEVILKEVNNSGNRGKFSHGEVQI